MALTQSNVKPKTYTELVEEARKLIPGLAPTWTNHNPSDPGIALIELFAWLTEMALYRVERVPRANYEKFLCLLKGDPTWHLNVNQEDDAAGQADALETAIRETILGVRKPYRAITAEDYTRLIMEDWPQTPLIDILPLLLTDNQAMDTPTAIAAQRERMRNIVADRCAIPPDLPIGQLNLATIQKLADELKEFQVKRYLQHNFALESVRAVLEGLPVGNEKSHEKSHEKGIATIERVIFVPEQDLARRATDPMPGHVTLIVICKQMCVPIAPTAGLRAALWAYLDERRLLTTHHHVVEPDFLPVTISATLHLREDALWEQVKPAAEQRLGSFFDPLVGGPQEKGWPLGRAVYHSEVNQVLENTPGVDYVTNVQIDSATAPGVHQLVAITPNLTESDDTKTTRTSR